MTRSAICLLENVRNRRWGKRVAVAIKKYPANIALERRINLIGTERRVALNQAKADILNPEFYANIINMIRPVARTFSSSRTLIKRVLVRSVLAYLFISAILWQFQEYLLFPVLQWQLLSKAQASTPPAKIESFFVTTPDGEKLNVWTTYNKIAGLDSPYVGLIFHGNGETVASMNFLPFFARHGIPAFTFDYRGYGESTGWPSEEKMREDAQTVWDAIKKKTGKDASQLVILGNSIGSGPASYLAASVSPRALILIAGFSSMPDILNELPIYRPFLWVLRYQFNNVAELSRLHTDCAISAHGKKDSIISFDHQGRIEKALAHSSAKKVVLLRNDEASHNDIYYAVENELNSSIDRCLGTKFKHERWP